jgi:hypothetical protein
LSVGRVTVWRSVFLATEGQAKEVAAQHGEQRGKIRKVRRLPRGECIRRNVAAWMMKHHGRKMPAAKGDREVELRAC